MFNFCIDCTYLSVNRVNGIGEKARIFHLNIGQNCIVRHPFHTTCLSAVTNEAFTCIFFFLKCMWHIVVFLPLNFINISTFQCDSSVVVLIVLCLGVNFCAFSYF